MESRPLSLSAMARRLGVKIAWLREEAEAGRIPALRAGDTFLFSPEAVEERVLKRAREEGGKAVTHA